MIYTLARQGSLEGNGVVPFGEGTYFSVVNLTRGTATVHIDTGLGIVAMQGTNANPEQEASWATLDVTVGLDGGADVGDTQLLQSALGVQYVRFLVTGSAAGRTVSVSFLGQGA